MSLLGWEDIRFTADESNAIAMLKAGRDLPGEVLSQLYQATDGWAAGLVLLMESLGIEGLDFRLPRGLGGKSSSGISLLSCLTGLLQKAGPFCWKPHFFPG